MTRKTFDHVNATSFFAHLLNFIHRPAPARPSKFAVRDIVEHGGQDFHIMALSPISRQVCGCRVWVDQAAEEGKSFPKKWSTVRNEK